MDTEHLDYADATTSGFAATQWSVVLAAGRGDTRGREALNHLCQTYWRSLYFFVRRNGCSPADAQDLTQKFFARFLEKHAWKNADPAKGKFRSYLLTSMRHFLFNEWERDKAQKRGGGARFISLDTDSAETRYSLEAMDNASPEKLFEREWALTLMDKVLTRLKAEQERAGNLDQFEVLRGSLMGDKSTLYSELGRQLRMSEDATKMAVHRLRKQYGKLLREEIAQTVSSSEQIEEEIQHLLVVLGRG